MAVGTCLVAGTYGLVRLAYGLFLPDIQASLSMSSAVAGYVSSGASAAYCLGALGGLVAAGRPRLLVVGALATAAVGSLGMAVAPGQALFVPAAVLASAGAGLASPGLVAVVSHNLPAARVDRAQATVNAGTGPGLVAAALLALVLPDWRAGFAVAAAFTAAAGFGVLLLDRPGAAPAHPVHSDPFDRRWLAVLRRPLAGAFLLGTASAAVWTYGRAHLVSAGAGDSASVLAWLALGVGGTATVLSAPWQTARPAPRAWLLTTVATAGATAALVMPGPVWVSVVACGVFGWGFVAATSALIAWTAHLDPRRTASGASVVFIALVLGQAAGSSAAGALAELAGMSITFGLAVLATLLAASCGAGGRSGPERAPRDASPVSGGAGGGSGARP